MKTLDSGIATHIAGETTTLAECCKATLTGGTTHGFTVHDEDIAYSGVTYQAETGVTASALASNDQLSVDNQEIVGLLDSSVITEADVLAGVWDGADVRTFQINWANPPDGIIKKMRGKVGEITVKNGVYVAELRSLSQIMQQNIGQLFQASCRADLGDSRCGVDLTPYTFTGTVAAVTSRRQFTTGLTNADDYFAGGKLTWTSGLNDGLEMEVAEYLNASGAVLLHLPMPYTVAAGDTFSVHAGCRKRFTEDCVGVFNNGVNFRGEPHAPGNKALLKGAT